MNVDHGVPSERPQIWPEYQMSHSLNVAWLGEDVSTAQMYALEDAWDVLVVRQEWRDWVRTNLIPASPFLYLGVRDDLSKRTVRKTPSGASMEIPDSELSRAEANGTLIALYLGIIHDVYARWADRSGHPAPPDLPDIEW